jgi:hypothetical protein
MIEYYDPDLLDCLSADLLYLYFNKDETDTDEYEGKLARFKAEEKSFERDYPQFRAQCEVCGGEVSYPKMSPSDYAECVASLRKRGWVVLAGEWDEKSRKETVRSNCFHSSCHYQLMEDDREG